jgi:hypothetical protein
VLVLPCPPPPFNVASDTREDLQAFVNSIISLSERVPVPPREGDEVYSALLVGLWGQSARRSSALVALSFCQERLGRKTSTRIFYIYF